ncbi:MAG: DUF3127 domain-containing protein [Prevotella sp.]|nr:DUF3127 domain-containing protein [Prevotella sp.]
MEITGKIIAVLDKRSGTSQRTGNTWASQEYVLETHDQYPRRCLFNVFGEDKIANMNIQIGEELTVSFDIDAREYNGRWFNDIRAWKVERVVPGQTTEPMAYQPMATPAQPAAATPAQPEVQADPFGQQVDDGMPF